MSTKHEMTGSETQAATATPQTTQSAGYNGWSNYETWCVALWLDNDEGSYNQWHDRTRELGDELKDTTSAYARLTGREIFTLKERVEMALSEELKDSFEEENPLTGDASVWADLMNAALDAVNWREMAEHYTAEVDFDDASTEEGAKHFET